MMSRHPLRLCVLLFHFCCIWGERYIPVSNETLRCMEMRRLLFHSVKEADRQRFEWERFLPVFIRNSLFSAKYTPADENKEMEFPDGHQRFHMLGPVGPECLTAMEPYGKGDEEKRACGLKQLELHNTVNTNGRLDCVVYSIGSNNQWGFEEAIVANTNCRVETFDCTVRPNVRPPPSIAHRVRLHRICLSDSDFERNGRQFMSWKSLKTVTGIQTSPTFLKMDIEGYEFPVLRSIVDAGEYLPLQIAVEIHYFRYMEKGVDFRRNPSSELLAFFQYLYKFGGYYLIDRRDNRYCNQCTEVVLAKLNCHNHPKPEDFDKIILGNERIQTDSFKSDVRKALSVTYNN